MSIADPLPEFDDSRAITYEQFHENMVRELASHGRREEARHDAADPERARGREAWFEFMISKKNAATPH